MKKKEEIKTKYKLEKYHSEREAATTSRIETKNQTQIQNHAHHTHTHSPDTWIQTGPNYFELERAKTLKENC